MSDPASSEQRRTWGRALIIVGLVVVLGGVAAWIAIPRLLDINTYRSAIEAEASRRLGRSVRIGRMELTAFPQPTAVLHDLAVVGQGTEGETVLTVPVVRARARLMPLLASRQLELTDLTLEGPEIALVRAAAGGWNWQAMLEPKTAKTEGSADRARAGGSHWQPARVTITRGTIRVTDAQAETGRTVTWTLQPFELEVRTGGAGRPIDVDVNLVLAAEAGRGALRYQGRIGPLPVPFDAANVPLEGDLETEHFPLRAVLPYVRREDGIRALDGLVTSDLHLALGPGSELEAKGDLELDQVHYALGGSSPRSGTLDVAAKVDLSSMNDRQDLAIRQLELTLPDGRLAVSGEVRNAPQGPRLNLKVDGRQVNLPALEPLARLAGFELPIAALGARPFDVEGAIERQTASGTSRLVLRDLHLREIDGALHGGAGESWSAAGIAPAGSPAATTQVEIENLWIENSTLTIQDQSSGSAAIRLTEVDLKVDRYGSGKPGRGSLAAHLPDGGSLSFEGTLAPSANGHLPIKGTGRIKLPSGTFAFTGTLDRQGGANLVDLSVAPTRVKIEDLQSLAAWVGVALPGTMQSPDPIEIALRARGNLADRSQLHLDGSLKATRLTWNAPFLQKPLTNVAATLQFTGDGFEAKGFTATLGETTWRGDLGVHDLGAPRVNFALSSDHADLGQLMSALTRGPSSGQGSTQGNASAQTDLLNKAAGGGTIAIKSGTFNTLAFSDLRATVALDGRTIRCAPLGFGLYGGKYAGESAVDLRGAVPLIQHDCALVGVDANELLSANTNLKDVLHGTLSARFDGTGSGQTMEALLKSLVGSGDFKVVNGTLTRSSMLKGLSEVAGLFGERTLTQLSQRMTTNETPFSALSAAFRIAGGQLTTDNLVLNSTNFSLAAKGQVALDRRLGFQGRIVFSDLISRTLREEGSRAIYLGEENGRVAIPVAVSGTLDRPAFAVDFGAAAGYAVAKTITDRLADAFERRQTPKPATPPPPATKVPPAVTPQAKVPPATTPTPAVPPPANRPDTTSTASKGQAPPAPKTPEPPKAPPAGELRVRVDSHQFRGDRAQPDLAVKGAVSGSHLAGLLVVVTDDGGRLIHQEKRLVKEIAAVYGNRPRSEAVIVPFDFQISGKRLPATAKSIKMTLVAVADNGKTSPPASIAEKNPRGSSS